MVGQPGTQILSQPHIVKLPLPIQRINPVPATNVLLDDLLMLFQCFPGNVFEMLANEVVHFRTSILMEYERIP